MMAKETERTTDSEKLATTDEHACDLETGARILEQVPADTKRPDNGLTDDSPLISLVRLLEWKRDCTEPGQQDHINGLLLRSEAAIEIVRTACEAAGLLDPGKPLTVDAATRLEQSMPPATRIGDLAGQSGGGWKSAPDIAKEMRIKIGPLDAALRRLRRPDNQGVAWVENEDRRPREPRYLHAIANEEVKNLIARQQAANAE